MSLNLKIIKYESEIREEIHKIKNSIEKTNRRIIQDQKWLADAEIQLKILEWCLVITLQTKPVDKVKNEMPTYRMKADELDDEDLL